jgi:hypothetical protein
MHRPFIEGFLREAIGDTEGLDRRGDGHHREFRQQDDGEMLGKLLWRVAEHGIKLRFEPFLRKSRALSIRVMTQTENDTL